MRRHAERLVSRFMVKRWAPPQRKSQVALDTAHGQGPSIKSGGVYPGIAHDRCEWANAPIQAPFGRTVEITLRTLGNRVTTLQL